MMKHRRKGYLLFEVVIATAIIGVFASFVSSTFIAVVKDNRRIRTEKELYESAMAMENIVKINVKKSNSLSQVLFNDIIIKEFKIDKEYEADSIAFDKTEKSAIQNNTLKRFVISKYMGIGHDTRKSLWFMNVRDDVDFSYDIYRYASKYEAGNYVKGLYVKKLDEQTSVIKLELELNQMIIDYSFTVKTI